MTSKPWFKGELGKNFSRLQQEGNILPRIALTATDPSHPDALEMSCHAYTARILREHLPKGNIEDTDELVLLGHGNTVFHSILTRGNDEVLADNTSGDGECRVDLEAGTYHSDWYARTNPGMLKDLQILRRISISDFKREYLDRISLDRGTPGPDAPEPDDMQ